VGAELAGSTEPPIGPADSLAGVPVEQPATRRATANAARTRR
jgi:hypothetical protein